MSNTSSVGFVCPEYDRTFSRRDALGSHMRVHAPIESQPTLVYQECGRRCRGQRGLTSHPRLRRDPETNRKVSENSRMMWSDKELHDRTVERIAKTNRSDEGRRRISEGTSRRLGGPETRRRLSESSKANWEVERGERRMAIQSSPEARANMSKGAKNHWSNIYDERRVEFSAKRSIICKETNSRSEVRRKISESLLRYSASLTPDQIAEREKRGSPSNLRHGFIENQLGESVYWWLSYERRFCECMLEDPGVVVFRRACFAVHCGTAPHIYIPDFRVWRTNGTVDLVEVRSVHWIETDPMVPHEISAANRYCRENGMTLQASGRKGTRRIRKHRKGDYVWLM